MSLTPLVLETQIAGRPLRRGKVRDVYDLGDELLIVATDRISAFDVVMPTGIPDKGAILTNLSAFWLRTLDEIGPHHLLDVVTDRVPAGFEAHRDALRGRSMRVRKTSVVPIEAVVRGYLAGSGWKEYQRHGTVCGISLPRGLRQADRLPEPIFTPATKAETGHDENIPFEQACAIAGADVMQEIRRRSLAIYSAGADYARQRGIILADTKFEFGRIDGGLMLIDEVLTPDSSRFWPADAYEPGRDQPSFDKQYVRNYLESIGFAKQPPGPALPPEVVAGTAQKYAEAYQRLTGAPLVIR